MKAKLVYWHKARLHGRYVLEMEIYQVGKSERYPQGIKYGLILTDPKTGKRVLMDNHHPKGPHIHLNDQELPYDYVNEEKLIKDFKELVLINMEVKI
ncbi:MAG: DUF6516 family protein [Pseudomonadota bacterium]